ncbi:hypothetical protein [Spirosoma linguale]|uniref:hypothetical protein n=1 Tax=Spirosoma linguale TaxID=108 RepID=UPI0026B2D4E9
METAFRKPYLISWLAIPVLLLAGFLFRKHTVNIQLYDTYFVIANSHVALAGSALLLILGLGYWLILLTGKSPNVALTLFHLLPTIGVPMLLALPMFSSDSLGSAQWLSLVVLAFIAGQCVFVVNILMTLLRK